MNYPIDDPEKMYRRSLSWDVMDDFINRQDLSFPHSWESFFRLSEFEEVSSVGSISGHMFCECSSLWMRTCVGRCRLFKLSK